MKDLVKMGVVFAAGMITYGVMLSRDIDKGDVVYDGDDMYVKASSGKSGGYSFARVNWKNPPKEED